MERIGWNTLKLNLSFFPETFKQPVVGCMYILCEFNIINVLSIINVMINRCYHSLLMLFYYQMLIVLDFDL